MFKKVTMPKGQSPKLKGSICNVSIDTRDITDVLPRGADSNGIVMVKLKRKLMFHGHVYFEPVYPDIVMSALQYLKANNSLYNNISIDLNQIPENLIYLTDMLDDREIDIVLESQSTLRKMIIH